jgi:hypothetical protein
VISVFVSAGVRPKFNLSFLFLFTVLSLFF